jgi:hypothetical protein
MLLPAPASRARDIEKQVKELATEVSERGGRFKDVVRRIEENLKKSLSADYADKAKMINRQWTPINAKQEKRIWH